MLQKLNERIQGVVAWLVVVMIAITFTFFGIDYYMQTHQASNAKVVVNGEPLTNQAFEVNYRRARAQQDIGQMTSADEQLLQTQVLQQMVTNEVTIQAARRYGFNISGEQVNAAILNIAQFQEDGHFSAERYQQALNAALFTAESFHNEVKQGMLLNQQRFAFVGTSFALPSEIDRFVRLYMQTRNYDYLIIPAANLEKNIQISDQAIADYYSVHQKEWMSPEQVSIDYVRLSMNDIRSKIKISDEDVVRYYNENKSNYLTPAQWRVAHILFAVPAEASLEEKEVIKNKAEEAYAKLQKNPQEFTQLLTLSDDKLSLPEQGVLPWIMAGQSEYSTYLSSLNKKGEISAPVETKYGFEIFKLMDYKPVTTKPLNEMTATIKEQLITDMAQAQYAQALEQLSDLSYQTPDSLSPVAETLQLKIQKTKPFSRATGLDALGQNKQVTNAAFSHDVLDLGNNSEPIQLDSDSVIVLRVDEHTPKKQLTLEQVESKIKAILAKKAAEEKAKELGLLFLKENAAKQESLMQEHHWAWKSVDKASRDNTSDVNTAVNELAFNLSVEHNMDGSALEDGNFAIVKLKEVNEGSLAALDKEQQASIAQQIEASFGMMDYDLYIHDLVKNAKVEKGS